MQRKRQGNLYNQLQTGLQHVYVLEFKCGLQYVSRNTQALRTRMNKHCLNAKKRSKLHNVSRHACTNHNCDFVFRKKISENVKNRLATLSQREM